MRVNVYAEEMTERIEIIEKETADGKFTGLRFYLELPMSVPTDFAVKGSAYTQDVGDGIKRVIAGVDVPRVNIKGPFLHRPNDDDSSAVTFWGKRDLREVLKQALDMLDEYYDAREPK